MSGPTRVADDFHHGMAASVDHHRHPTGTAHITIPSTNGFINLALVVLRQGGARQALWGRLQPAPDFQSGKTSFVLEAVSVDVVVSCQREKLAQVF
ncbi:MAG TPA: hypothetical protein VMS37_22305, partial [Verrucomicrobiae bacterium]|nr:hypothetical protein [Verrucomicrobiae bacterium]